MNIVSWNYNTNYILYRDYKYNGRYCIRKRVHCWIEDKRKRTGIILFMNKINKKWLKLSSHPPYQIHICSTANKYNDAVPCFGSLAIAGYSKPPIYHIPWYNMPLCVPPNIVFYNIMCVNFPRLTVPPIDHTFLLSLEKHGKPGDYCIELLRNN